LTIRVAKNTCFLCVLNFITSLDLCYCCFCRFFFYFTFVCLVCSVEPTQPICHGTQTHTAHKGMSRERGDEVGQADIYNWAMFHTFFSSIFDDKNLFKMIFGEPPRTQIVLSQIFANRNTLSWEFFFEMFSIAEGTHIHNTHTRGVQREAPSRFLLI
jgi:hypothetical protein